MADAVGCAITFCDGFPFGDQENGAAFGRHLTSTGEVHLVRLQMLMLGSELPPGQWGRWSSAR